MFSPCSPFWSLSSLARPRSLGRLPKRFFVTRTAQNTIRKNNDKKNDRPKATNSRRSYFLMWHPRREADHCADSAFPYLYYRRQHADCQAPEGIAIRRFLWYPYLQERRCSASAAVMLPSSVSLFVSSSGGSPIFCHPPDGSIVFTWDTWRRIPSWKF